MARKTLRLPTPENHVLNNLLLNRRLAQTFSLEYLPCQNFRNFSNRACAHSWVLYERWRLLRKHIFIRHIQWINTSHILLILTCCSCLMPDAVDTSCRNNRHAPRHLLSLSPFFFVCASKDGITSVSKRGFT